MLHSSKRNGTSNGLSQRLVVALAVAFSLLLPAACTGAGETPPATPPAGGPAFWDHWGDGRAEMASYDLVFPRYGQTREGTAVTVFVTETFSDAQRVKTDRTGLPVGESYPVMKLNLVIDFPTGVYDYNIMTSAFVALAPATGRGEGHPVKVSTSVQEWCGHVYEQALFHDASIRIASHSYFEGEADQEFSVDYPAGAIAEDALLHWARGLAAPKLKPGETRKVPALRSLLYSRLRHVPPALDEAILSRGSDPRMVQVPAGSFEVEVLTAEVRRDLGAGDKPLVTKWTFYVETAYPHRLVEWETDDGLSASLVASERLAYWKMSGPGGESHLKDIGLTPRPPRTP